jgi:hypothetical protein
MLNQLAHPMAVPFPMRRSAQAALAVLSLFAPEAACPGTVQTEASHLRVHLRNMSLWATRCERPLLVEDAAVLAAAGRKDVLIVRLSTSLSSPVTFDWIPSASASGAARYRLLPALPYHGGLALVDALDEDLRVDVTAEAILVRPDMPPAWRLQRELAAARASAFFKSLLWGGL